LDLPDAPEGFFCTFAMARMLTKAMAYVNGRRGVVLVGCWKFAQPVEGGESRGYWRNYGNFEEIEAAMGSVQQSLGCEDEQCHEEYLQDAASLRQGSLTFFKERN
jgi:hypothetical protein